MNDTFVKSRNMLGGGYSRSPDKLLASGTCKRDIFTRQRNLKIEKYSYMYIVL